MNKNKFVRNIFYFIIKYICNIQMEVAISKVIRKKFKYINNEEIVDILSFISDKCMKSKGILIESTGKLSFKIQKGGKKKLIKLEDDKVYEYHIDGITPIDDNQKQLNFMNLTENHDTNDNKLCLLSGALKNSLPIFKGVNCVCFYFDRKSSEDNSLIIQSLMNEYIINSEYKMHDNFNLSILSTLLKGVPYYYKYKFEAKNEKNKKVLEHNIRIFNKKTLLVSLNIKIIFKSILMN